MSRRKRSRARFLTEGLVKVKEFRESDEYIPGALFRTGDEIKGIMKPSNDTSKYVDMNKIHNVHYRNELYTSIKPSAVNKYVFKEKQKKPTSVDMKHLLYADPDSDEIEGMFKDLGPSIFENTQFEDDDDLDSSESGSGEDDDDPEESRSGGEDDNFPPEPNEEMFSNIQPKDLPPEPNEEMFSNIQPKEPEPEPNEETFSNIQPKEPEPEPNEETFSNIQPKEPEPEPSEEMFENLVFRRRSARLLGKSAVRYTEEEPEPLARYTKEKPKTLPVTLRIPKKRGQDVMFSDALTKMYEKPKRRHYQKSSRRSRKTN
jgi:hypothetical protein